MGPKLPMVRGNRGFSLLEVMVAATLLALTAGSVLGLAGYHKKMAAKVERRQLLFNRTAALLTDVPYIIAKQDEDFPFLRDDEEERLYEGTVEDENAGELVWKVRLVRADFPSGKQVFRVELTVSLGPDEARMARYIVEKEKEK